MKEEKISIYRVLSILGIAMMIIVTSAILCIINHMEIDKCLSVVFVILGFFPVFVFELLYERKHGWIGNNSQTNYRRVATGVLISSILLLVMTLLPEFYRPVILLALIMTAFSNPQISMTLVMLYIVLMTMTMGGSLYELLAYIVLAVITIAFSKALSYTEYRPLISIVFMFASVLFPSVFYYMAHEEMIITNFVYCIFNGALAAVYTILLYPKEKQHTEEEIPQMYQHLLEEDYIQIREVRAYSMTEYRHARRVSEIAAAYADNLGLDAKLAAAAGFYYRLGRWEGEPIVENGVKKAEELCFPMPLIQILKEYNAEEELPSTPESALVHIIDAVLIKIELLDKEVGNSQWNREVLIYQTLNELSTKGLYDKSGLSINRFIKIREWLAKEEQLG